MTNPTPTDLKLPTLALLCEEVVPDPFGRKNPDGTPGHIICEKPAVARLNVVRLFGGGAKLPVCADCLGKMDPTSYLLASDPASLKACLALGFKNAEAGYPEASA